VANLAEGAGRVDRGGAEYDDTTWRSSVPGVGTGGGDKDPGRTSDGSRAAEGSNGCAYS